MKETKDRAFGGRRADRRSRLAARQTIEALAHSDGGAIPAIDASIRRPRLRGRAADFALVISIDAVEPSVTGSPIALPAGYPYDAQTGNLGRVRLKTAAPGGESFAGLVVSFTAGWPSIGEIPRTAQTCDQDFDRASL
ncbi:MAG: hypothetical protein R3C42_05905 [Parvularculaceae bacterium]